MGAADAAKPLLSNVGDCLIEVQAADEAERGGRKGAHGGARGIQAAPVLMQARRLAMIRGACPLPAGRLR